MRDWMKEKRCECGLTMAQVAEKLGITESYYSMIEAGDRQKKMDIFLAEKISSVFGVPLDKISEFEKTEGRM